MFVIFRHFQLVKYLRARRLEKWSTSIKSTCQKVNFSKIKSLFIILCLVDFMASWLFGKLTFRQVDFLVSWLFGKLTLWRVGYLTSWLFGKLTFWQVGYLASWLFGGWPFLIVCILAWIVKLFTNINNFVSQL